MVSFPEMFSLAGKTAVVTGGTRGIGSAMALAFAEAGADIILIQRDTTSKNTHDQITALGRSCTIHTADLSDHSSVQQIIPTLSKAGHNMHILLTCAGIQKRHDAHEFPDDDFDSVLQVNLRTVWTLNRDFGAYLLSKPTPSSGKCGSIINIASLMSYQGGIRVPAYAAAKGGVSQLTKALSNEWVGKGINVNAIVPGYIATDMNEALINDEKRAEAILGRIPAGRWGRPDDFKGAAVWLASEASGYVSGTLVDVDGGWMAR